MRPRRHGCLPFPAWISVCSSKGCFAKRIKSDDGIIGDETYWGVEADVEYPLRLSRAKGSLTALAIHNYDFPTYGLFSSYAWIARTASGLPIPFTETCCSTSGGAGPWLFGSQYDPTIVSALVTSRYVWPFLTLAKAESFDWWVALSGEMGCSPTADATCATQIKSNGWNDGLIYFDPDHANNSNTQLYLTKRYWALISATSSVQARRVSTPQHAFWCCSHLHLERGHLERSFHRPEDEICFSQPEAARNQCDCDWHYPDHIPRRLGWSYYTPCCLRLCPTRPSCAKYFSVQLTTVGDFTERCSDD